MADQYCKDAEEDGGPEWILKYKSLDEMAVDFAKYVIALGGQVL